MDPGSRCQASPPVKYRSGFHTLPAPSVLGGPSYPARKRTAREETSDGGGADVETATGVAAGLVGMEGAGARWNRYAPKEAKTRLSTRAAYFQPRVVQMVNGLPLPAEAGSGARERSEGDRESV